MFTGIIETTGTVLELIQSNSNLDLWIGSNLSHELKIDQSVAHNGVCLTVVELRANAHRVTAIAETLAKTNLGSLLIGQEINIERCMLANGRFDGHIVQGHVDDWATCSKIEDKNGSWEFEFTLNQIQQADLLVAKGSICINGTSLTVVQCEGNIFSVAIIPYTYEHTNFKGLEIGDTVNLEFDILGKYIQKQLANRA